MQGRFCLLQEHNMNKNKIKKEGEKAADNISSICITIVFKRSSLFSHPEDNASPWEHFGGRHHAFASK